MCCALCCIVGTQFASGQYTTSSLLKRGDSIYRLFNNQDALYLYKKALAQDTTSYDALLRVSRTSYDFGLDLVAEGQQEAAFSKFEDAILHAQALVKLYPDSARSHFLLAATLGNMASFKHGREKIALGRLVEQHSKKAITIDSTLAYPYVSLGIYFRELSQLNWLEKTLATMFYGSLPESSINQSLDLLQKALHLRPDFPFLHFELAMTLLSINRKEEAMRHLETLINLAPENTQDARNQRYAKGLIVALKKGAH